jgi:hypothetical protein
MEYGLTITKLFMEYSLTIARLYMSSQISVGVSWSNKDFHGVSHSHLGFLRSLAIIKLFIGGSPLLW